MQQTRANGQARIALCLAAVLDTVRARAAIRVCVHSARARFFARFFSLFFARAGADVRVGHLNQVGLVSTSKSWPSGGAGAAAVVVAATAALEHLRGVNKIDMFR